MRSMKFSAFMALVFLTYPAARSLAAENKLSCAQVQETEAKCKEYDAQSAACDTEVSAILKAKTQAAKDELDKCKKKNSFQYVLKCKKELKEVTTAENTPVQVASRPVVKELGAKPESACAKVDKMGSDTPACKLPKKAFDTMKANCIKDAK